MTRITNDLFEAIRKVTAGQQEPQLLNENAEEKVEEGQVDKAHYCATHVEHPIFGDGECIAEAHADPDADGNIEWYTVKFNDGIRKVYTEAMKVKKAKMHEHADVSDDVISEMVDELSDEELAETLEEASYSAKAARAGKDIGKPGKMFGKIAASAAKRYGSAERGRKVAGAVLAKLRKMDEAEELDELDKSTLGSYVKKAARDVQQNTYRSGLSAARGVTNEPSISKTQKRQQGIAKAVNKLTSEDIEQTNEAQTSAAARYMKAKMSSQAKTTMKHVANPTAGEKQAAKDIKPGIAGYSDRVAMLKSAEKEGRLKEGMDPVGKEDSDINNDGKTDKSDSYLHNRRKAINRAMVKESIVIVTEQEIEIEIPSELSFADYLDAVKYLSKDDPTISEADIIKMATLAHKENDVDLILEAAYNRTREGDKMYSPELDADIDRSKPGVTRVTRRIKPGEGMGTKQSERKLMKRIASRNK